MQLRGGLGRRRLALATIAAAVLLGIAIHLVLSAGSSDSVAPTRPPTDAAAIDRSTGPQARASPDLTASAGGHSPDQQALAATDPDSDSAGTPAGDAGARSGEGGCEGSTGGDAASRDRHSRCHPQAGPRSSPDRDLKPAIDRPPEPPVTEQPAQLSEGDPDAERRATSRRAIRRSAQIEARISPDDGGQLATAEAIERSREIERAQSGSRGGDR